MRISDHDLARDQARDHLCGYPSSTPRRSCGTSYCPMSLRPFRICSGNPDAEPHRAASACTPSNEAIRNKASSATI